MESLNNVSHRVRTILHCDMNNFYASVECMLDPALKKEAVAVCGSVETRHGIVLAKNYKAKELGVKTGEAIWQAKQKCPQLVVVPPHYEEYLKFSRYAKEIYARYTDLIEPYGMDECWLDVTGSKIMGNGYEIACELGKATKFELGLTISIGVSFNKIFAKLGSDMKKPDAITCIPSESFRDCIWHLPASELLGVGRATAKTLGKFGIVTIGDLAVAPDEVLKYHIGKNGLMLKDYANGPDFSRVKAMNYSFPIKSIGHGITAARDLENGSEVWRVMLDLVQSVGSKLKLHGMKAGGVAIAVRDNQLVTRSWQKLLPVPTQSSLVLAREGFALFEKNYRWGYSIRSITIKVIDLVDEAVPIQFDFFTDYDEIEKCENLDVAVENIRSRFGKNIIRNGSLFQSLKTEGRNDIEIIMPTGMVR